LLGGRGGDDIERAYAADERGYYLTQATLTEMGPDGRPRVVVRADTIEQQLVDDSVHLAGLELDYTSSKTGVWHVTADRGRMPPDKESLLLAGNVRVVGETARAEGNAVILTDELAYDTRTNVVQTAAPVVVNFGPHELLGRGMRVELNEGTLRLESNVDGRFTP
jgi:LPS export ABC transporter protein LptC